jgi:hypothetical protein
LRIIAWTGGSFIPHRLSDGNDPNAVLGEPAEIEFLLEGLAEETAVAVDNDKIERTLTIAGTFDHLLEARPSIIAGRRTSFNVFRNHVMAIRAAPRLQLASLIRNGKIVLSLPTSRYAHIEGCTECSMRLLRDGLGAATISVHGHRALRFTASMFATRWALAKSCLSTLFAYSTSGLTLSIAALSASKLVGSKDSCKSAAKYVSTTLSSLGITGMSSGKSSTTSQAG